MTAYRMFEKTATPRYEKELASGRITRDQLTDAPLLPEGRFSGPVNRKLTRDALWAPAPVAPERLEHTRKLNQKLFEQQSRRPPEVSPGMTPTVHGKYFPGAGPTSLGGDVFVPPSAGRFLRTGGPMGDLRTLLATSNHPAAVARLAPAHPADASLGLSVLRHEFGEAYHNSGAGQRPVASHGGPRAVLEEAFPLRADPEAWALSRPTRVADPEDRLLQRIIRRAGGTPNSPLPIGGRGEAAVNRMLDASVAKLSPETRQRAVSAMGQHGTDVKYVPQNVKDQLSAVRELLGHSPISGAAPSPGGFAGLRRALSGSLNKFVRKG